MGNQLEQFLDQKYINLETYKKDGTPIRTPVWFVIDKDLIYVITRDSTGKVKRLRNNQDVRIVPCSFKGEPKNEWIKGKAEKITGAGLLLIGENTPSSASDYLLGINHILPTNGFGRTRGGLSVLDFLKLQTVIESKKSELRKISKSLKVLTDAEDLPNHYKAVKRRLD